MKLLKSTYGHNQFVPLDIYLGIDKYPFKITTDMALRIAMAGATSTSYVAAQNFFRNAYDIVIGDDRIREVTNYIGNIVFQDDKRIQEELCADYDISKVRADINNRIGPNPKSEDRFILYILMDGGTFNSREGKDKNGSTYREHKLGLVFKSTDLKISQKITDDGEPIFDLKIGDKREYMSYVGGVDEFRKHLLAIAIKNGLYEAEEVSILGDGADWIHNTKKLLFPYAKQILDFYHLSENVSAFARYLIDDDSLRQEWVTEVLSLLEKGAWQTVLALPEVFAYKTAQTPKGVPNLYTYIFNHRDMLNYPEYRKQGYFIGSGAIESGIKSVGHLRLKLLGMKWWNANAQTILSLRAKLKSNLWVTEVIPLVYDKYGK